MGLHRSDDRTEDFESWRQVRAALARHEWEHVGGELAEQRWVDVEHWPLGQLTVRVLNRDRFTERERTRLAGAGFDPVRGLPARAWRWAPVEDDVAAAVTRLGVRGLPDPGGGVELAAHLRREQALCALAADAAVRVLRRVLHAPVGTVALLPPELQADRYA